MEHKSNHNDASSKEVSGLKKKSDSDSESTPPKGLAMSASDGSSRQEKKQGSNESSDNIVLTASARPVVIPIHKVFAPVSEAFSTNHALDQVSTAETRTASTDDSILCSSCMSQYSTAGTKAPKLLPCLHTFCLECVKSFIRRQCATCRKTFKSADELPDNFMALEALENLAIREGKSRTCEECEDEDSSHRCATCFRYLCTPCKNQHLRSKATKTHSVQTLEEMRAASWDGGQHAAELCSVVGHTEQRVTMFCVTCSRLACMQCVVQDHPKPQHDYCTVEQAFTSEAAHLNGLVSALEAHDRALDAAQRDAAAVAADLAANGDSARAAVRGLFESLRSVLAAREARLVHEVEAAHARKAQVLADQLEAMRAAEEQMRGAQAFVDAALRSGAHGGVLRLRDALHAALADARRAPGPLLAQREDASLSLDPGGLLELEAAIKSLGRVEHGPKPPPPQPSPPQQLHPHQLHPQQMMVLTGSARPLGGWVPSGGRGGPMAGPGMRAPPGARQRETEAVFWMPAAGDVQGRRTATVASAGGGLVLHESVPAFAAPQLPAGGQPQHHQHHPQAQMINGHVVMVDNRGVQWAAAPSPAPARGEGPVVWGAVGGQPAMTLYQTME